MARNTTNIQSSIQYGLGATSLIIDIGLFIFLHILVIGRRNYQPLKIRNWVLCLTTAYHKLFTMSWIGLRQINILSISCRALTWNICGFLALFLLPFTLEAWRVVWIHDLEQQKGNKTIIINDNRCNQCVRLQCMKCCRISVGWRLMALACIVLCPPIFFIPPTVNLMHKTYDKAFDFETCIDYDVSMMVPFLISFIWTLVIAVYAVVHLKHINDLWGMGRTTLVSVVYIFWSLVSFVTINLAMPNFSSRFFESGWICWIVSTIGTTHQVLRPTLQTFWLPQQKQTDDHHRLSNMRIVSSFDVLDDEKKSKSGLFHYILTRHTDVLQKYCEQEYSTENILLWKEVEQYRVKVKSKTAMNHDIITNIHHIQDTYLSKHSISQVNLPYHIQIRQTKRIQSALARLTEQKGSFSIQITKDDDDYVPLESLFDITQAEVKRLIESDTFSRFVVNAEMSKWIATLANTFC